MTHIHQAGEARYCEDGSGEIVWETIGELFISTDGRRLRPGFSWTTYEGEYWNRSKYCWGFHRDLSGYYRRYFRILLRIFWRILRTISGIILRISGWILKILEIVIPI